MYEKLVSDIEDCQRQAEKRIDSLKVEMQKAEDELRDLEGALRVVMKQEKVGDRTGREESEPPLMWRGNLSVSSYVLKAMKEFSPPGRGHSTADIRAKAMEISGRDIKHKAISNALTRLRKNEQIELKRLKWHLVQQEIGPGNAARPLTPNLQKGGDA